MNNLSWVLYAADVLPGFMSGLAFSFFIVLVSAIILVGTLIFDKDVPKGVSKLFKWPLRVFFPIAILVFIMNGLMPTKNTILMIAASEASETIVTSKEGREILLDIKKLIKQQLKDSLS